MNIYLAYISKHSTNHEKQVTLSMIASEEEWY